MQEVIRKRKRKPVICIPTEQTAKAGCKAIEFDSIKSCAAYFDVKADVISQRLRKGLKADGFFFDYK